ncbi:serine/threonine protein kinase [Actinomadura sp. 9N407]|uniref:serine/threonine protein kinase n=1 Tax=Actinomadura sp. 9N407 TaxID=3375154 RepID=UPI0037BA67A4
MTDRTMPDAHPLRSGDPATLGAYEILGRLGEGGQGAVYLGRRAGAGGPERLADYVAIKLLHAGLTADVPARNRFVRELDVAKRVARFCTAQVLDADLAGDQPYIVSEYVPGQSLHRLVQEEGPRTGGALERLAISTLTALYAIHQAGIVHRDFKPHNVMMGPDGPRVIDFGVARALGAAGETQNVGTPAYMAPEHFSGAAVGPAADMFAWGTTMVFAATGRPAFGNDEMAAVMHRILTGDPDLGDLPSPLREVVESCLAKEPEQRPTAREAQERLVGAAPGEAPAPLPPPVEMPAPPPPFAVADPLTDPRADPLAGPPAAPLANSATSPQPPPYALQPQAHAAYAGPPPHQQARPAKNGHNRLLIPLAAAMAVAVLLAGGAVWATTRGGDEKGAGDNAAAGQQAPPGTVPQENLPGGTAADPKGRTAKPEDSQKPGTKPNDPKAPDQPGKPQTSVPPATGGGGGGGTPAKEPANKYTPQGVCNAEAPGGGYYVQRSMAVAGGRAYQLYSSSSQYNCAVTMKTKNVGKASSVSVWIQASGGSRVSDGGSFAWYAGPAYVKAPGKCVRYGSGSTAAPYGNCG